MVEQYGGTALIHTVELHLPASIAPPPLIFVLAREPYKASRVVGVTMGR